MTKEKIMANIGEPYTSHNSDPTGQSSSAAARGAFSRPPLPAPLLLLSQTHPLRQN